MKDRRHRINVIVSRLILMLAKNSLEVKVGSSGVVFGVGRKLFVPIMYGSVKHVYIIVIVVRVIMAVLVLVNFMCVLYCICCFFL
jgi:hypothetical protein